MKENKIIVLDSGHRVAIDRSVGVSNLCITIRDNIIYLLICKGSNKMSDSKDLWNIPSGYLNWDETSEQAAIRETKEETGIEVSYIKEIEHSTSPLEYKQHIIFRHLSIVENFNLTERFRHDEESSEIKWIEYNKLSNDYKFAFNQRSTIDRILNKINISEISNDTLFPGDILINKKKSSVYIYEDTIINATNSNDGQLMVIYKCYKSGVRYCRELNEMMDKFYKIKYEL